MEKKKIIQLPAGNWEKAIFRRSIVALVESKEMIETDYFIAVRMVKSVLEKKNTAQAELSEANKKIARLREELSEKDAKLKELELVFKGKDFFGGAGIFDDFFGKKM